MKKTKNAFMACKNYIYCNFIVLLLFSTITYATTSEEQAGACNFNEKVETSTLKLAGGGYDLFAIELNHMKNRDAGLEEPSISQEPINTEKPPDH
ncbi:hypothetical protein [Sporosarcina ureae]|uniref:hypothetical protein n=1 Tax=Sporosarcina ureae TaxID=1571 RepID=UPI0009DC8145|nr:hypothetical protein [Sporosarcina ureae]ARF16153.1 hypothetical protein SporoP17a_01835 [Sporosarcina ureae]